MCGIVGAVGADNAALVLMDGLRRLEYRGYDSAGIAVVDPSGQLVIVKREGKLQTLADTLDPPPAGSLGIGHTRWATHGPPTQRNAHPHSCCHSRFALVHNGIIENHDELHQALVARGHEFTSETDTEVLVHLLEEAVPPEATESDSLLSGLLAVLAQVQGAYAVAAIGAQFPNTLVAARNFSPLVLGKDDDAAYVASDIAALIARTRHFLVLDDGQAALLEPGTVRVVDSAGRPVEPAQLDVTWDQSAAERGGYDHFVRKEIEEQPEAVSAVLLGRASPSGFHLPELDAIDLAPIRRAYLVAAGSSSYAALGAKHLLEQWARLPAEVAIASEFRYSSPVLGPDTLVVLITQSGETADTLAALRLARASGSPTLAITNVVGSSVARGADSTLYLRVGPEIGVVATKSFTGQVTLLTAIAADVARRRGLLAPPEVAAIALELLAAPDAIRRTLELDGQCTVIAHALARASSVYFIGRGPLYPIAMEAALKLKEITYIPAEGFAAGELKHGPIALLEHGSPVVAFTGTGVTRDKTLSNIAEVRARGAHVIAIGPEHDEEVARASDEMIPLPAVSDTLLPLVSVIPAQMLAYHAAIELGRDVDQPRNLAKSVTVE